jgi:subtilisin family serine protease
VFYDVKLCSIATVLSVILLIAGYPGASRAQNNGISYGIERPTQDLLWDSISKNATDFSTELSELYLTLYNTGRLTVRPVPRAGSESIEAVLRNNKILVGPRFPVEIDSLACDLNANRCTRDRVKLDSNDPHVLLTKGILGQAPSRTKWTLSANDSLVLPAIRLEVVPRWVETSISDPSIDVLVTQVLGGCLNFDDQCRREILQHNRSADLAVFQPNFKGTLSLPVIAARASVNFVSANETVSNELRSEPRPEQALVLTPSPTEKGSFKVKNYGVGAASVDVSAVNKAAVLKELLPNTIGAPKIKLPFGISQALVPADFSEQQVGLSDLISFPYKNITDFPISMQGAVVAVFDGWVDPQHCALGTRFDVHNVSISQKSANLTIGHCDQMVVLGAIDHGTLVAGIIGAKQNSDPPLSFGLNPYARIETYEVDFSALSSSAQLASMARSIDSLTSLGVDVANISFGYMLDPEAGIQDPVQTSIANLSGSVLFVTAAGNYGSNVSYICDLRPSCFDLPNVISVAGLNRNKNDPKLYEINGKLQTNYGSHVHVGAIGEKVFGPAAYGNYGIMSGSSPAAPQVAAVASLVMKKYRHVSPQEVKNRLIYCSDHIDVLGARLFAGRLNADCTIDEKAWLRLKTTPKEAAPLKGYFQAGSTLRFREAKSGRELVLPLESVRGIELNQQRKTYAVYYNADRSTRDSQLLAESNLIPAPPVEDLTFVDESGSALPVQLDGIVKYASTMK